MRNSILSKIINDTYEQEFRRKQNKEAMLITFRLEDESIVKLLLIWEGYVGVFENIKGEWNCLSCHDSCWRGDGVESFINKYGDKIRLVSGLFNWFERIQITEKFDKKFRNIERERFN